MFYLIGAALAQMFVRVADARGHSGQVFKQVLDAAEHGRAAHQHNAHVAHAAFVAGAHDFGIHHLNDFRQAGFDDGGQRFHGNHRWQPVAQAGHFNAVLVAGRFGRSHAVFGFHGLGLQLGHAATVGNVTGYRLTAKRQHGNVPHYAFVIHHHVGGAATHVHKHHATFLFIIEQGCQAGRQRGKHQLLHFQPEPLHAHLHVFEHIGLGVNDIEISFQPHAQHPDGVFHAVFIIHAVGLRHDVDHLAAQRRRGLVHIVVQLADVLHADFGLGRAARESAALQRAFDVSAADVGIDGIDPDFAFHASLQVAHGLLDGLGGAVNLGDHTRTHHALLKGGFAHSQYLYFPVFIFPPRHHAHFGAANVKAHYDFVIHVSYLVFGLLCRVCRFTLTVEKTRGGFWLSKRYYLQETNATG